jgi:uncharacterized protein (DUF58 family)
VTSLRPAVPRSRPARPGRLGRPGPPRPEHWSATRALGRAVLVVALLLVAGVLLGRVDMVVLAAPFAFGAALGLWRRPHELPVVSVETTEDVLSEGSEVHATLSVGNPDPVPFDLVVLRTAASPYLRLRHLDRPYVTTVPSDSVSDIGLDGRALRWGRPALGPAVAHAFAADGLLMSAAAWSPTRRLRVYPATEDFEADDAMPRAAGLVGAHRSRRPGEGGELAGVRMFAPGDRLRRIDWRVSLRTGELHVAATLSDRDAEVVLLLDVLHEAGRSGGVYGTRSVMDTTVRAAAGIAEHYLQRGDRVALVEYGLRGRRLRPASGRRQYLTALEWLLDIDTTVGAFEPSPHAFGPHLFSANALLVVLTPLLDTRSAAMLARLGRGGRFVVAIDTLPPGLPLPVVLDWHNLAGRLWKLERENTVDLLREHGIPVVAWAGAGSLDQVLRQVARMASGPKAFVR